MCEDCKNAVIIFRFFFLIDFASSELMPKASFFEGCKTAQRQSRSQGLSCPRPLKRNPH